MSDDSTRRVLVLRALGLGDLLAALPALRALRRAYPDHELVLAAPEWLAPLAGACGAVDTLLPAGTPDRAVPDKLDWTGPPPDVAVDLHGNGTASRDLLAGLGPRRLLAFAAGDGPRWLPGEHERDRWCRLLTEYGVPADPRDLRLPPPPGPPPVPGAVVVHPGADAPARRWPAERFAAVAGALRDAGHPVVVTGGPTERCLASHVAARGGLPPRAVHCGRPLDELSRLVAGAAAVVSGDTGVAHLAVAHGTPSVTLFGPVPPAEWGPPDLPRHRALRPPGPRGDPHGSRPDPLLLRLTTDDVLTALRPLLLPGGPR